MEVIETEYSEIRGITLQILAGTIDKETAMLALIAVAESGKRVDQYLKVVGMISDQKVPGRTAKRIIGKNIISDSEAITMDTFHQIIERVVCPAAGGALRTREECLDYSGDEINTDRCGDCEQFGITRKRLSP